MKHTPGPWRITENGCIASQGYVPIRTPFREGAFREGPGRSDHPEEVLQANARLIAAAPELLEALKEQIEPRAKGWKVTDWGIRDENARAAIAKAEGGPR
jgi:hypothetical protein